MASPGRIFILTQVGCYFRINRPHVLRPLCYDIHLFVPHMRPLCYG